MVVSPQARETKEKNEQIGLHQTNTFLHSKGNYRQNKRHPTEWENIFSDTSDKGLISKLYKVFTKLNIKKQTTNLKNGEGGKGNGDLSSGFQSHEVGKFQSSVVQAAYR